MNKKYLKHLTYRILLCIILFLVLSIFINSSDANMLFFRNNIYERSFNFAGFNNFWTERFGRPLPDRGGTSPVGGDTISFSSINPFQDGAKLEGVNIVTPFKSGIVVFVGERDYYGMTVIIQGMNGIDYWYGNLTNVNVRLYDYVTSDNIIANAKDNTLIVAFKQNGEVLDFEEFI